MANTEKVKIYKRSIFLYGFITLTYLMSKYENLGRYEDCQMILDALNSCNKELGLGLPTKYDDNAWQYFLDSMQGFNMTGEHSAKNIPYYAEVIEEMILAVA